MNPRFHLPLALLLAVVVRVPFWSEALRTPVDGDTAIIGLMARHPGRGTTMWGQPYGSPVEAWLATPFLAAFGTTALALRRFYFLLGLGLVPVAYLLGREVDPRAAFPAAVLLACPPPYFLLLAAMPPPLYPTTLLLCGLLLILTLRAEEPLSAGARPLGLLALAGTVAGLALWTHLMSASVVAACAGYLLLRLRRGRRLLLVALVGLLAASAPWWCRAVADRQATRIVSVSGRQETLSGHLLEVLPQLHRPVGAILGTHVPVVADDPESVVFAPGWMAAALIVAYGLLLISAARVSGRPGARLLFASAALALLAFPFPLRSGPAAVRFLTLLYLPVAVLVAWVSVVRTTARRAWIVVLLLACFHLTGGSRLLAAWRDADRAKPPFLLPDLEPVRRFLDAHAIRRAYASYGPAYRMTYESGERIVASQPWNERFLHHPLPYLDEVRFAKNVAWVLTPKIPTDMPAPKAFEEALGAAGGSWERAEVGEAVIYHGFTPPFGPAVERLATAGAAGDGDLGTVVWPAVDAPTSFTLPAPLALDGLTLVAGTVGPGLLRSMDVEVSADGAAFETVARRRRRGEREDLRWVNGHPQYVLDHDLLAIPLGGRTVAAIRVTPYASADVWALGEILLHRAESPARRPPWDEWLDPHLSWAERRAALFSNPRPDREDWYFRGLLTARARYR